MITKLAKAQKGWAAKLILTLTALSFMSLFGVSSYISNANNNRAVIKVDNIEILQSQFAYQAQNELALASKLLGENQELTDEMRTAIVYGLSQKLLNDSIMDRTAKKHNVLFSPNFIHNLIVNDVTYSAENIIFSDKEIIVKIADKVVNKVNITLNCLNLAPSDYNVSTGDYKYTVQLIPDKPNYEYVYVVVTLNEGYEFGDDVKVYVNNKEVAKKMFVINGNTLKYTQDDPNWTDIF